MDARDAALVLGEARRWAQRGLLSPAALEEVEREYGAQAASRSEGPTLPQAVLFSLAGVLLAAACIAFTFLSHLSEPSTAWTLAVCALAAAGIGAALRLRFPGQPWGDALLVTGLVCAGFAMMPDDAAGRVLVWLALALALAAPWLAGVWSPVPIAAVGVFTWGLYRATSLFLGRGSFFFDQPNDLGVEVWVSIQALYTVGLVGLRWARLRWWSSAAGAASIALVVPVALFTDQVVHPRADGVAELVVALPEFALLALGIGLRSRELVICPALVIAVDAIVFAFDVGGVGFGVVALLAVAGGLVALAGLMRRIPSTHS